MRAPFRECSETAVIAVTMFCLAQLQYKLPPQEKVFMWPPFFQYNNNVPQNMFLYILHVYIGHNTEYNH